MNGLTQRQAQVLDFIRLFMKQSGLPPTRHDIAQHFGFASDNAAEEHLKALRRKGAIFTTPGIARGIHLADLTKGDP